MPQTKRNIPVSVGQPSTQDLKVFLDYHTKVIVVDYTKLPRGDDLNNYEIKPFRRYHKRTHFVGEPSHYDFWYPTGMVYKTDGYYYTTPNPAGKIRAKRVEYKEGEPHRLAGAVVARFPVHPLGSLTSGDTVMFRNTEGVWQEGKVGAFENYKSVRQQVNRARSKQRARFRRLTQRRTLCDVLSDADKSSKSV